MSTYSTPLVFGVFERDSDAKRAIDALYQAGFDRNQLGMAWRDGGDQNINYLDDLREHNVAQDIAQFYDNEFRSNRVVVSVNPMGRDQEARDILRSYGGYDYENRGSAGNQYAGTNTASNAYATTDQANTAYAGTDQANANAADNAAWTGNEERRRVPLREERLNVNKERAETGEVRLHKDVVTEQQSIDVPVSREEVYVQRRDLGGQPTDASIGQDESIRVPVSEEQVNVTKTPVETGEVTVGKRVVQDTERVSDTVRREEPRIDKQGNPNVRTDENINNA